MRVKAGEIGPVRALRITSRDPQPPPAAYLAVSGGMFRDMTIHDFDMARFLLGDIVEVQAMVSTNGLGRVRGGRGPRPGDRRHARGDRRPVHDHQQPLAAPTATTSASRRSVTCGALEAGN